MTPPDVISVVTSLFIAGMIWLRTRMQYPRGRGQLRLERAGRIYFGTAIGLLVLGWVLAPTLGRALWPTTNVTPTLMRVVWFLATYYVFILVHRVLKANGVKVFATTEP